MTSRMTGNGQRRRTQGQDLGTLLATSVATLVAVALVVFLAAAPFTWLLMLFLGNVGVDRAGFWDCLPGGALVGALVAGRAKS